MLDGDPLIDFKKLRAIRLRMKAGVMIEPPAAAPGKPAIAEAMVEPLMRGAMSEALALYDSLRAGQPDAYDFSEQQLNGLGYAMLKHGQAQGAIAIFEKNAALFPRSFNVFDSLADAYLAAGDNAGAVRAFEKELAAIAALPHRSAAVEKLAARARGEIARLRQAKE